jgi:hypothetical protein
MNNLLEQWNEHVAKGSQLVKEIMETNAAVKYKEACLIKMMPEITEPPGKAIIPDTLINKKSDKPTSSRPTDMTVESVKKMYIDEHKSATEISKHFGVSESAVQGFIQYRGITRKSAKVPEETERP